MAVNADVVYKDRDTIVAELIASWQARVPGIPVTADSVIRMWIEVYATTVEGLMLANQLLHDDIFPQTANALALQRYGDIYGRPMKPGTTSLGTLRFSGAGGTSIPIGTRASAPGTTDESLDFVTTALVSIPNPGVPSAPVAADAGAGTLAAGTYEYAVTFQTALGETALGAASNALVIAINHNITLTGIPLGGPGTTARNLYERVNGGTWKKNTGAPATSLANNTATTVTVSATATGGTPPVDSTAQQVDVAAASIDVGVEYNVGIGTVTDISDGVAGLATVTNPTAFTGASDPEDIEAYRSALLNYLRNPKTGSPADLEAWAEAIAGVQDATAFSNDNLGVGTQGHATVRITGPNGSTPSAAVQQAVLDDLVARDLAGITVHVATFTPKSINVTVVIVLDTGYVLADVTSSIQQAIIDYINAIPVGGTTYEAGVKDAVFGLPGVKTLTTTFTDTTSLATEKPVPGTITVS